MTAPQSADITLRNQQFEPGQLVVLFIMDLTDLGGPVLRFTSSAFTATPIVWDGDTYTPVEFEATGFEYTGTGQLPRPRLKIGNALLLISSLIIEFGDLLGGEVTRIRTYRRFLDGEAEADPTAKFPDDVYVIDRKSSHDKIFVEWELAARFDAEGTRLPKRQALREICTHVYRTFDAGIGDFDFTDVTCPYVDDASFLEDGTPTTKPNDRCGKRLFDCRLRFGQNGVLPGRFFPGLGSVR